MSNLVSHLMSNPTSNLRDQIADLEAQLTQRDARIRAQNEALNEGAGEAVHAAPRCSDASGTACCGVRLTLNPQAAAVLSDALADHDHPTARQILTALEQA